MNGFMSPRPLRVGSVSARSLPALALALALAGWLSGATVPALFAQESEAPKAPPSLPSEEPTELFAIEEVPPAKPVVARPVKPFVKKTGAAGVRAARPLPVPRRPVPADSVWAEPIEEDLEAPARPIRQVQALVPQEGLDVAPIEGTEPLAPLGEAVPFEPGQTPASEEAPLIEEAPREDPGSEVTPDELAPMMEETEAEPAPLRTRVGQPHRMPASTNLHRTAAAELVPYNEREAAPPAGGYGALDQSHTVAAGESFWTIAKKHYRLGRYSAALAEYNKGRIPQPDKIKPGMKVIIPPVETLEKKYEQLIFGASASVSKEEAAAPVKSGFFVDANGEPMYRVGEGDTLSTIAQDHLGRSSRWTQIVQLNPVALKNPDEMKLGMVLRLPANASEAISSR